MERYFDRKDLEAIARGLFRDERTAFEVEFSTYVGAKHALATSYGRTALYVGLRAAGIHDGEVLIAAFTCTVVRHAIVLAGATPRFVDVEFGSFNMSLEDLSRKLSSKTRAVIVTHYFGTVAGNLDEVADFARKNGLLLFEDCAHSLGAEHRGKKVGTFGDLSVFSLTKNMINFGGGVLVTANSDLLQRARGFMHDADNSRRARMRDLPKVLAYGVEQMIMKLHFDRIRTNKKKWLLKLPRAIIVTGRRLSSLLGLPSRMLQSIAKRTGSHDDRESAAAYDQCLAMDGVVAALGRCQLRKLDQLIANRKRIYKRLGLLERDHFGSGNGSPTGGVCTHMVLRVPSGNAPAIKADAWDRGVSLISTWTARQRKWRHLDSESMARIEKEILIYTINPDLTDQEIRLFLDVLGGQADQNSEHLLTRPFAQERQ